MRDPAANEQQLGATDPVYPSAREMQRGEARTGEYLCEACRTRFSFSAGQKLSCPKCHNRMPDALTPLYMEDDPSRNEMLGPDNFSAGD
jgi:hypothetical protein